MKISKLFHWLYAFVMFLPVFFIGVRCGYVMFNKNAKDSYSDSYVQDTTQITDTGQLVLGNYYVINYNGKNNIQDFNGVIYYYSDINVDWYDYGAPTTYTYVGFRVEGYQYPSRIRLYYYDSDNNIQNVFIFKWGNGTGLLNSITFRLTRWDSGNPSVTTLVDNTRYWIFMYYFKTDTLDNAFEYSVNQLNEVPLFSWAKTSFLVQPFIYISGLFGITSDNPINTLLSYWLAISIIWLTFDLVMYVPLLAHRWLDKGVLE